MHLRLLTLAIVLAALSVRAGEEKDYTPSLPNIKVNGESLSGEAIQKRYEFWLKVYKAPGKPLPKEFLDRLATLSRDQMVQRVAVRQHVEKNKLAVAPDVLKDELSAFKADLVKQGKTFEDVLKSRSKTEDEFVAEFAMRSAMTKATAAEAEKNIDELKKSFEKDKDKLPLRRVSQIRFSYEKTKYTAHPERTKEDAQKAANYALERLKKGEDFATLAKDLSDDSVSGKQGGDIGWIAPAYIPKTVAAAVYALEKAGDVSELIESEQGFHLIKMTELKDSEQAFKAFVAERVRIRTLAAENKLGKEAKVEIEKPAEPEKAADKAADKKAPEPANPVDPKKDAEPKKPDADKK